MSKTSRTGPKPQNRRGSPEAIEKRRAARLFNDVVGGRGAVAGADSHRGVHRVHESELLAVDQLPFLPLFDPFDRQPDLFFELIVRAVVKIGDPGMNAYYCLYRRQ